MKRKIKKHFGFTLAEILVVIAIMAIIAAAAYPVISNYRKSVEVESAAEEIQNVLRQAQSESMTVKNEIEHGVYFDEVNAKFILFAGTSYDPVATDNYEYNLSANVEYLSINFEGLDSQTVVFSKLSGSTSNDGNVIIRSVRDASYEATVSVNDKGRVSLN
ncbi:MAG: prepilin-type N-terminal cleavage/methylation domain-containing protein [bacterium]